MSLGGGSQLKEKIWVNIPEKYQEILSDWSKFYAYESEDELLGKVVVYSLYTDLQDYTDLITYLHKSNIKYYIFRRSYTFTKTEMNNAEILWFWTDDDAKDSYSVVEPWSYICSKCKTKVPVKDRNMLHVDLKKIKKYEILSTYNGETETIVSEKVKQLFIQEKISGVDFRPIYQLGKENQMIEGFYHLVLQEGIGDVVEPSIVEKRNLCPKCGMWEEFICKTTLNFSRKTWKGYDICYTKNWFGRPPKFKNLIVSNKLYKLFQENKIKNVYFQPAFFVD